MMKRKRIKKNSFYLNNGLGIGHDFPTRTNLNFGINKISDFDNEKNKLDILLSSPSTTPDIVMDLSTIELDSPLYKYVIDKYSIPAGIVPVYSCFNKSNGIDKQDFLDKLYKHAENGVSFFTLHLTANLDLLEIAKKRRIPITSRGGGVLIYDQIHNNNDNILLKNIEDIISLCLKYNIAISLGTTFRPSSIIDARDKVHIAETKEQLKLCRYLKSRGINVIVENIGHISLRKLIRHNNLLSKFHTPIMPLGPLPTDCGFEFDHIASAIGASILGANGNANIVNCITGKEHTSSKITVKDMSDGIKAAKLASHIIDVSLDKDHALSIERDTYYMRAKKKQCIITDSKCTRCAEQCPLELLL